MERPIEQGFDGQEIHGSSTMEQIQNGTNRLKRVAFNRPTNFCWFAMFPEIDGSGHRTMNTQGKKLIDDATVYDVMRITFRTTDDKLTDVYQLCITSESNFSGSVSLYRGRFRRDGNALPDEAGVRAQIEDLLIPAQRRYKKSTWDAEVGDEPWISVDSVETFSSNAS